MRKKQPAPGKMLPMGVKIEHVHSALRFVNARIPRTGHRINFCLTPGEITIARGHTRIEGGTAVAVVLMAAFLWRTERRIAHVGVVATHGIFGLLELLLPRRICKEDLGDAVELI